MLCQHAAGERFNFTEGDRAKTARAFKAKAKPAYSREQIEDRQHDAPPKKAAVAGEISHRRSCPRVRKETARDAPGETESGAMGVMRRVPHVRQRNRQR